MTDTNHDLKLIDAADDAYHVMAGVSCLLQALHAAEGAICLDPDAHLVLSRALDGAMAGIVAARGPEASS